jgi:hypothetical protein
MQEQEPERVRIKYRVVVRAEEVLLDPDATHREVRLVHVWRAGDESVEIPGERWASVKAWKPGLEAIQVPEARFRRAQRLTDHSERERLR